MRRLICAFVVRIWHIWFSHDVAHLFFQCKMKSSVSSFQNEQFKCDLTYSVCSWESLRMRKSYRLKTAVQERYEMKVNRSCFQFVVREWWTTGSQTNKSCSPQAKCLLVCSPSKDDKILGLALLKMFPSHKDLLMKKQSTSSTTDLTRFISSYSEILILFKRNLN